VLGFGWVPPPVLTFGGVAGNHTLETGTPFFSKQNIQNGVVKGHSGGGLSRGSDAGAKF
jgi:hypothetical protein